MSDLNLSKVLSKIEKCMRLSESSNVAEAAAALRQAQKLMLKYGLNSADLELNQVSSAVAGVRKTRRHPRWAMQVAWLTSSTFGVRCIMTGHRTYEGGSQSSMKFIGIGEKPQISAYTYEVLYRQLSAQRLDYVSGLPVSATKSEKTRLGNLYAEAWVQSAADKVTEFAFPCDEAALVDRWIDHHMGNVPNAAKKGPRFSYRSASDRDAIERGLKDGESVRLFRPMSKSDRESLPQQHD